MNVRQTVFYPQKNFINYITVRGFILQNADPNWASLTIEQKAIIGPTGVRDRSSRTISSAILPVPVQQDVLKGGKLELNMQSDPHQ